MPQSSLTWARLLPGPVYHGSAWASPLLFRGGIKSGIVTVGGRGLWSSGSSDGGCPALLSGSVTASRVAGSGSSMAMEHAVASGNLLIIVTLGQADIRVWDIDRPGGKSDKPVHLQDMNVRDAVGVIQLGVVLRSKGALPGEIRKGLLKGITPVKGEVIHPWLNNYPDRFAAKLLTEGFEQREFRHAQRKSSSYSRIVRVDETWVHYHHPRTKQCPCNGNTKGSPAPKTFCVQQSAGNVMATVFMIQKFHYNDSCPTGQLLVAPMPKNKALREKQCGKQAKRTSDYKRFAYKNDKISSHIAIVKYLRVRWSLSQSAPGYAEGTRLPTGPANPSHDRTDLQLWETIRMQRIMRCSFPCGFHSPQGTTNAETSHAYPELTSSFYCGGQLNQMHGDISSPFYPNYYPANADCTWEIHVPEGYYVNLTFLDFNLEAVSQCVYDSVTIYDGIPGVSPQIANICYPGNYTFYSSFNIMSVNFRSDHVVHLRGFFAVFSAIYGQNGQLPMQLVGGTHRCAGRVEIYYQNSWGTVCDDSWDLRDANVVCRQMNCGFAVAALSNAYFGQGSGNILLDDLQCLGHEPYLWECNHRGWGSHNCEHSEDASVICSYDHTYADASTAPDYTDCGGLLYQMYGNISSPFYPNPYPANANCTWEIHVPMGYYVKLSFLQFSLETASNCVFDSVTIYDGLPGSSPQIEKICYPGNYTFYSSSNIISIKFLSDISVQGFGFFAEFSAVFGQNGQLPMQLVGGPHRCAGRVEIYYQNSWGTVCDDSWDLGDANVVCRQMNCGSAISAVTNAHFGQGSGNIWLDDVRCLGHEPYLWECGHGGWGVHNCQHFEDAGVICTGPNNTTTDGPVLPNTSNPWITTAPNYTCGGVLSEPSGIFSSPLYPGLYPDNAFCTWEIRVLPGHVVDLSFVYMDLEYTSSCSYDYVMIYDGLPLTTLPLGKICSPINSTFTSSSNVMGVVFRTDGSVRRTGFQAVYSSSVRNSSQPVNCGGILTNGWGAIESPSYPYSYSPADCVWHIQNANSIIQIHFNDVRLEYSNNCLSESVSVYDGTPANSALLGKFCGTGTRSFRSSSNSLSIVYTSRGSNSNFVHGFQANYVSTAQNNQSVILLCQPSFMEARISVSYLQSLGYSANEIFLNDGQCRPSVYGDSIRFYISYNQCGTIRQGERDTISYSNTVHGYHASQIVQHSKKLNLNLRCQMFQNTMVDIVYHADDVINQTVTQYGLYNATLSFYYSPSFTNPVYQYPFYVELNQNLYLQATLQLPDTSLTMFVDTCVASPDPNDFVTQTYDLIRNGCIKDSTYVTYASYNSYQVRFGFRAFAFVRSFSRVYIQCKLTVCQRYNYNSRCYQGCISRQKRDTASSHEKIGVIVGPIELKYN
ncbi:scavenger receptor cysteine-rich domain-containing protein DMBT1-like [Gastrophryne carolinensis]